MASDGPAGHSMRKRQADRDPDPVEDANPQSLSSVNSVSLLLYARGNILRDACGPYYDKPALMIIKVKPGISYEELVETICRHVEVERNSFQVELLYRFPVSEKQFAVLRVANDDGVKDLLDCDISRGYVRELYVQTEQLVQDRRDVEDTPKVTQIEGQSEDNQLEIGEPSRKKGRTDPDPSQEIDPQQLEGQGENNQLEMASIMEIGGPSSEQGRTDPQVYVDGGHEYDVFLSFRGTDYRQSFVDSLYYRLVGAGIRTFLDSKELPVGEVIGPELMRAINQSKISIPIFSTDYAKSKWCLKEVTEMVKRMDERGHMILPIFLNVTPNEVQHQEGSYAEAFSQHEKDYDPETVKEWRGALRKVLQLKGLELQKETNGKQGKFIELVLARVLNSLKKGRLNVDEQILVGMDDNVEAVKKLLDVGGGGVKFVGIWGMGGIGKTTLAKFVYNQMLGQFDSSCFLNDIRESSKKGKGLPSLQSKLESDILKGKCKDFSNVDEGIEQLKCRLGGKKAIILLDDVDDVSQLKGLAGSLAWFGPGSRIIITTRDKEVLDQFEVSNIYEVMPLSEDQGFELFCKHAFPEGQSMHGFIDLARDIVRATGMLPLTLEVIGSFLLTKLGHKEIWDDTMKKLSSLAKPEKKVQDILKISYDGLSDTEKEIFLDIACIFIGMDSVTAIPMWEDCKWFPHTGLDTLKLRSLIKITDENEFLMHDQIRDLGRVIVEGEISKPPRLRSRLWRPKDIMCVLEGNEVTTEVEAIDLGYRYDGLFEGHHFRNVPNLRILQLGRSTLGGKFKGLLAELRWLSWEVSDEWNPIPTDLHLRNLISLEVYGIGVEEDWDVCGLMKVASKLKVLHLRGCKSLTTTPDLTSCPALERLDLRGCMELRSIDPSIEQLSALVALNLRGCESMESLPNLEHLTKLKELYLDSDSKQISKVPGLQGLISLETLQIGRSSITHLDDLEMLERLRELEIFGSPIERLPNLSKLKRLTHIVIGSAELRRVGGLEDLESLERLTILQCERLVTLPDLSKLCKLKSLIISGCHEITEIRGLEHLESLEILGIQWLSNLKEIDGLAELENLETLILSKWGEIGELLELSKLQGLEWWAEDMELDFLLEENYEFDALKNLPNMSNLRRLRFLKIEGLSNLTEIVGLEGLVNLETLEVSYCDEIKKLLGLSELHRLRTLTVRNCVKITEVRGLGDLESLEEIEISDCVALENLPNMSKLRRLRNFQISHLSDHLSEIVGLEGLNHLQTLEVSECGGIEKLSDLSELHRLKSLTIGGCEKINEVRGLGDLESLEEIDIWGVGALGGSVLDVSKLRRLRMLKIGWLFNPVQFVGLGNLKSLEDLRIRYCGPFENLTDLTKLQKLKSVVIDVHNLTGIGPEELKCLESLTFIRIMDCNRLTEVEFGDWIREGCHIPAARVLQSREGKKAAGPGNPKKSGAIVIREEPRHGNKDSEAQMSGASKGKEVSVAKTGKKRKVSGPGSTSRDVPDNASRPFGQLGPSERGVRDPTAEGNPDSRTVEDRSTTAMDQGGEEKDAGVSSTRSGESKAGESPSRFYEWL